MQTGQNAPTVPCIAGPTAGVLSRVSRPVVVAALLSLWLGGCSIGIGLTNSPAPPGDIWPPGQGGHP